MKKIKYLISMINAPRLLFHDILFCIYYKQCKEDVDMAMNLRKYPIHKNGGGKMLDFNYLIVFDKYYRAIFYKRIGLLKYLVSWLAPSQETFIICNHTKIGKGMLAVHPYSTQINAIEVGDFFIVKNGVTIGEKNGGIPTIGSNVLINVNSVIAGNVKIGNNVIIGASTLIMKDVPNNCVVAGNPAYIIKKNGISCKERL